MKELFVTKEMEKFQSIARQKWEEKKSIDVDAVCIGWKLHKGSVIVDTAKGFKFRIADNQIAYDWDDYIPIKATINGEEKNIKFTKRQIASIILQQPCLVYYS